MSSPNLIYHNFNQVLKDHGAKQKCSISNDAKQNRKGATNPKTFGQESRVAGKGSNPITV